MFIESEISCFIFVYFTAVELYRSDIGLSWLRVHCSPIFVVIVEQSWMKVDARGHAPPTLSHTLVQVNSILYVIGGMHEGQVTNKVTRFSPASCEWLPLYISGPAPAPR